MLLILHERRTKTNLVPTPDEYREDCCAYCDSKSIQQLEPLKPNIHGLKDDRGNTMMEQEVSCTKCGQKWVDVFCRVYSDK